MKYLRVIYIFLSVFFSICTTDSNFASSPKGPISIYGLMPGDCKKEYFEDGLPAFQSNKETELYIFGKNLHSNLIAGLAKKNTCDYVVPSGISVEESSQGHVAVMSFLTPSSEDFMLKRVSYYICLKDSKENKWNHYGLYKKIAFYIYQPLFPTWFFIALIMFCFLLSSLMSGLNIGLMALDQNELSVLKNAGSEQERKFANKIIPVRKNGNFLLCSILITATLCNSVATVCLEKFVADYLTIAISTIVIVLFCEILPQSVCTYFPLYIGAHTISVTKMCMYITSPVSYPLSMILNLLLGKELATTYNKERLKELLKMTPLPTNEEKIIAGTLDLSQKKVEEVMTMLDDIFKLPITAVMDFETIALILSSGYSRIPIYVGNTSNILYVLLTKDLALLDPDDQIPVKVLVQHSKFNCRYLPKGTTLDSALSIFKESRGHMAFIVSDQAQDDQKDMHVVGLITFEDVIEEIFQAEINDETDTYSDNRFKRRLSESLNSNDFLSLLNKYTKKASAPSENLKLATFHFLSGIDVFSVQNISPKVLLCLMSLDVFYSTPGLKLPQDNIYIKGIPADFFVMILEGLMEVKIGTESLKFEAGPFRYFGVDALSKPSSQKISSGFIPDYSLQAVKKTLYIKIPRVLYDATILATNFERFKKIPSELNIKSDLNRYFKQIISNLEHHGSLLPRGSVISVTSTSSKNG